MRALTELKKECFKRIGSNISCFCCGKDKYSNLLIHHLSYTEKSITYNKFENSDDGRLKYYANLLDEIKIDPDNFLTMCFNCHKELEELLRLYYDEVLLLARQRKIREMMIMCYDLTRIKRNLNALEDSFGLDETLPPKFIIDFDNEWDRKDFYNNLDSLYNTISILSNRIQSKSLSIIDFAESVILNQPPENYLMSWDYVVALRMLESVTTIKKGDKILYVRIINKPRFKPVELVMKAEIDTSYYHKWFMSHIIIKSNGLITKNDLDKILGIEKQKGLDAFF